MPGQFYFSLLNPVIAAILGAMFLLLYRRWPAQKHLAFLATAFFLAAIGFIFNDFTPLVVEPANRLVSNGAFVAAVLAACSAALCRAEIDIPRTFFAAITSVGFAVFGWFLVIDPSVDARIMVMGLLLGGLTAATAMRLAQANRAATADRLLIAAAAISVVLALLRPMLALLGILDPADGTSFQQSSYWISVQAFSPILIGAVAMLFLAAMSLDTFDQLKAEANHDYLTGLLNRRGFETAIIDALAQAGKNRPALLMADIDDFKQINDRFGHKVGDQVIAGVARALSSHGNARFAARVGGEEFALYYDHSDAVALHRHAEAIRMAVRRMPISGLPADHRLTLSIGLHRHSNGETLSEMLIEADRALYKAKANGKDRAVISTLPLRSLLRPARLA